MEDDPRRFDEGVASTPMSREAPYAEPQQHAPGQQPYGYGTPPPYGYGYGYGSWRPQRPARGLGGGRRYPIETRPFFLTSEFLVTLLAIVALGITAAAMDIVDARLTWILTAAMVVGYVVSRGVAKAASRSYSVDPREDVLRERARPDAETQQLPPREHAMGPGAGFARDGNAGFPAETKPFFVTSEFLVTALAIVAVAITAASMPNLGARLTWILVAAMVVTYALSRGLAKAGTRSYAFDPREELLRRAGGAAAEPSTHPVGGRVGTVQAIETKPFFVTSEFLGTVLAIVAIAISAAAIDILNVRLTWILITAMVCGYVLSRGIAKIGIGSDAGDPRELLLHRAADGSVHQQHQPAPQR